MAHLAKLGGLADELVILLTSTSSKNNPSKYSAYKESALRAFRYNNYARTNQFDVASQLNGLEEKFRVYNEDPLADALKERVEKVMKLQSKWTPEILHLLLELSDRPLVNAKVEDLDFLKEPEPESEPPLRWQDLMAEDPLLREKSVWRNVDFGAESSDDAEFDDSSSERSETTEVTTQSSVEENIGRRPQDYLIDVADKGILLELRDAQFWLKDPMVGGVKLDTVKKPITELQAIREVLFMLSGYPTSLFKVQSHNPNIIFPSKSYTLKHASVEAFHKQLHAFAEQGTALQSLRLWVRQSQTIPLIQVFQDAVSKQLMQFEGRLSDIQTRYVELPSDVVVSILQVQAEVTSLTRFLLKLVDIVKKLDSERYSHAFRYLEILFKGTCTSQMAGDAELYKFMGTIFFDCFQVYLLPIRTWMEEGNITPGDKVFFVSEAKGEMDPAAIWQSRFKLRQTQDGKLHAPAFLRAAANKIFATGKSVVILKQLNRYQPMSHSEAQEPPLAFDSVCDSSQRLAPFTELFAAAFDAWIQSKHHHASTTLRKILFDNCGLHSSLNALAHVYFMADGSNGAAFTNPLFDKLDRLDTTWSDRFNLIELLHGSIGTLQSVNPDRLRVSVLPLSRKNQDIVRYRTTVKVLGIIEIKYHLSWPIQIILDKASLLEYQRIFTFLFQIRRSSHIISRRRVVSDLLNTTSSSDERSLFYSLRSRLLWFIQTLYYYLSSLVIEPGTSNVRKALMEAVDVDTMIRVHSAFMKSTTERALLGSKLEVIHKTILKILDVAIKLEDAETVNANANKEQREEQENRMDLSMASLGLHTPRKQRQGFKSTTRLVKSPKFTDVSSDENEEGLDVDFSILSSSPNTREVSYVEQLRTMKTDFDRLVRFVVSGLKGVARAGAGEEAKSWDILGEMLETGLGGTIEFR